MTVREDDRVDVAVYADNDRMSGVAVWIEGVAAALEESGRTEVVVRHPSGSRRFERRGLQVHPLHGPRSGRGRLGALRAAYRYGRRSRPRVVHCTAPQLPVILGLRLARIPVTCSLHVFPRSRAGYLVVSLASLLSSALITVSESLARAVTERGTIRAGHLRTIPNGVAAPTAVALDAPGRATFAIASRLTTQKGLDDLADWAPALVARSGWPLHVFGEGPLEPALRADLEGSGVVLHGRVDDEETLYSDVGALLVLSEAETFCRPAFEAAVRGIPVISRHPLPVLEELLGALVIHPENPSGDALADTAGRVAEGSIPTPSAAALHTAVWPSLLLATQSAAVASVVLSHARHRR